MLVLFISNSCSKFFKYFTFRDGIFTKYLQKYLQNISLSIVIPKYLNKQ